MNKVIFTSFFRIGGNPNLDAPYASNADDKPKYGIRAMFPQNGITKPTGRPDSSVAGIIAAFDEVCQAEFGVNYATFMQYHAQYGVQYPPKFVDGNTVFLKDAQGKLLPGQVRPECANMWILSLKNADPVDLVAPNGQERLTAAQMCAGYWARAQIEVSAYKTKTSGQQVFSVKLLNMQLAYTDEKLSMGGSKQDGIEAFGNMAITDTNVAPAFNGIPQPTAAPAGVPGLPAGLPAAAAPAGLPAGVPGMPAATAASPAIPGMPAAAPAMPAAVPGMPNPAAVGVPTGIPTAAPAGVPAAVPGLPVAPAGVPNVPGLPVAPAAHAVNTTDRVIMKAGQQPLAAFLNSGQGWTPELLVQHGYADWNINYVG